MKYTVVGYDDRSNVPAFKYEHTDPAEIRKIFGQLSRDGYSPVKLFDEEGNEIGLEVLFAVSNRVKQLKEGLNP